MDGREIEPRVLLWAVAEVSWQDASGAPCRSPGTLEDTSRSGACLRLKGPLAIGSTVTIRWQREQFSAITRNCRRDGRDFLVGLKRQPNNAINGLSSKPLAAPSLAKVSASTQASSTENHPLLRALEAEHNRRALPMRNTGVSGRTDSSPEQAKPQIPSASIATPAASAPPHNPSASPRVERKDMEPKTLFPSLWRRPKHQPRPGAATSKEVEVNQSKAPAVEPSNVNRDEMLSYQDIYCAAGIMNPVSGYGIHKVMEMLNSERIRDLSNEIKRASVLMALDAACTSVDQVLTDASRRQQALDTYESGKKKQLEDFESAKTRDNEQIEQEMERMRAHYAERIQRNRDLVADAKQSLRNWQMATQHEMQRIAEVIELCGKPAGITASKDATVNSCTQPVDKPDQARGSAAGRGQ